MNKTIAYLEIDGPQCKGNMIYLLTPVVLTPSGVEQYTFTHKQYTEQHNKTEYPERNIHKIKNR